MLFYKMKIMYYIYIVYQEEYNCQREQVLYKDDNKYVNQSLLYIVYYWGDQRLYNL